MAFVAALFFVFLTFHACFSVRVVTEEELATKVAKNGDELWLSILGEVYDVSAGAEYYGQEDGYGIFAGRDATVPFQTGKFDKEGAAETIDSLDHYGILSVEQWREFYQNEEKYHFVGVLDSYMYDSNGEPTEVLKEFKRKLVDAKIREKKEEEERKVKAAARKEKRRKEKEEKERLAREQAAMDASASNGEL